MEWTKEFARAEQSPVFSQENNTLSLTGNGKKNTFGWWNSRVAVTGGKTYLLRVEFIAENIADINLNVLNLLTWRISGRSESDPAQDHITYFWRDGDFIIGEQAYKCHRDTFAVDIQLLMRYSPNGKVTWHKVELCETAEQPSRPVRVSAVKWHPSACETKEENLRQAAELIGMAAKQDTDIILLPEFGNQYTHGLDAKRFAEKVPGGDYCSQLSKLSAKYRIYIASGILELDDEGNVYNKCVLFGRSGEYIGGYRKIHLYWPESMFSGILPGEQSPVFDLDFGRVGIMTCYDCWYSEPARLLGLKGAEIILFPNAGYEEKLLPARTIDNNLYIVCSSIGSLTQIMNTTGDALAVTDGRNMQVITVEIDLAVRPLPHINSGGSMNPGAGGRRAVRNTAGDNLYKEIAFEMGNYIDRKEKFTWL